MDAVRAVIQEVDGKFLADEDDVKIKKHVGETMDDAEFIRGIIIEKKRVSEEMPKSIRKARIALIATPLEITKTQVKSKIKITSPDQLMAFDTQERGTLRHMADAVIETGANVILCQKGIADAVQYYLAKEGIMAIEDVPEKDMLFAARALNGQSRTSPTTSPRRCSGRPSSPRRWRGSTW